MKEVVKIFFVAAFILTIAACDRKSCENVACPTGQACHNGNCYCPDGYEGTDCQTLSATKYLKNYNLVSEQCNPLSTPFFTSNVFIQADFGGVANRIQIYNLMGCTYITAIIRTDNSNKGNILEIPEQQSTCSGNTVSGQGTYDELNGRINLQLYYSYNNGITYQCNTTLQ